MNVLIGADPEVFVKQGGKVISGYGLIPGTKKHPHPVPNGAVQVDGMALEFNITPAVSVNEFVHNVTSVLETLRAMVPKHELAIDAVAMFERKYLNKQPDEALQLGCDPDYNAYTVRRNDRPDQGEPFRTAAGHVHIGWTSDVDEYEENHINTCLKVVKNLDTMLGVPSILFDECSKRRALYGKAGAFRPKPYGVEYRVLSNKWLKSIELMQFVYNTTVKTVLDTFNGLDLTSMSDASVKCINSSDRGLAIEIIKSVGMEPDDVLQLGRC